MDGLSLQRAEAFAPAKVNLYLAVTGVRSDGFHNLVSLVVPVDWGDRLTVELDARKKEKDSLECDMGGVPVDEGNLVLKAAALFRRYWDFSGTLRFRLAKRIPMGAGLGGGSSDALAALRCLEQLSGIAVPQGVLHGWAADLGSDCPFFLSGKPQIMRGRGEVLEEVPEAWCRRFKDLRLLLFKPSIGVYTPWAYAQLKMHVNYTPEAEAERELKAMMEIKEEERLPLKNQFEGIIMRKHIYLRPLWKRLHEFGYQVLLSGSGSACFVLVEKGQESQVAEHIIEDALGKSALLGLFSLWKMS